MASVVCMCGMSGPYGLHLPTVYIERERERERERDRDRER